MLEWRRRRGVTREGVERGGHGLGGHGAQVVVGQEVQRLRPGCILEERKRGQYRPRQDSMSGSQSAGVEVYGGRRVLDYCVMCHTGSGDVRSARVCRLSREDVGEIEKTRAEGAGGIRERDRKRGRPTVEGGGELNQRRRVTSSGAQVLRNDQILATSGE